MKYQVFNYTMRYRVVLEDINDQLLVAALEHSNRRETRKHTNLRNRIKRSLNSEVILNQSQFDMLLDCIESFDRETQVNMDDVWNNLRDGVSHNPELRDQVNEAWEYVYTE